jgi:hypothetical protein
MSTTTNLEACAKWIGIAEVLPKNGNSLLGTATGAYVNVLGLASTATEFQLRVTHAMQALDFELVFIEEIRPITDEIDVAKFDETLRLRISELHEGNPVEIGSFHAFSED